MTSKDFYDVHEGFPVYSEEQTKPLPWLLVLTELRDFLIYHLLLNYCLLAMPTLLFLGRVRHLHYTVIALAVPASLQVSSLGGLSSSDLSLSVIFSTRSTRTVYLF